jgi:hypothetical protein
MADFDRFSDLRLRRRKTGARQNENAGFGR